jgi:tRNA G18 (ribose-2'-O)-methylase SpoU
LSVNIREFREQEVTNSSSEHNVRDKYKLSSIEDRKQISKDSSFPFWVMSLNMTGDLNIGTMMRSAHLLGAEKFVIWGRRKIDNRSLVGTSHYMDVVKVQAIDPNLNIEVDQFEAFCEENKLVPFFLEQGGENVFCFDWKIAIFSVMQSGKKPILVVGTESSGIPKEMLDIGCDMKGHILTIPQRGVIRSHNASMAFSIVAGNMISSMGWF